MAGTRNGFARLASTFLVVALGAACGSGGGASPGTDAAVSAGGHGGGGGGSAGNGGTAGTSGGSGGTGGGGTMAPDRGPTGGTAGTLPRDVGPTGGALPPDLGHDAVVPPDVPVSLDVPAMVDLGPGGTVPPVDTGVGGGDPPLRDANELPDFGPGLLIEDVRLNEIDCHGNDWVEVKNLTDEPFDLEGWVLTDVLDAVAPEGHAYVLPEGTLLEPDGFGVIFQADQGDGQVGFDFGIGCGDEHVRLVRPDGSTADFTEVPERDGINTWGRFPDGTGDWTHTTPTRGNPNQPGIDPGPILYDVLAGGVPRITLFIAPEDMQALAADPRVSVPGDLQIQLGEDAPIGPFQVGVHLKGRIGSFRPISGKAGFKIDINEYVPAQRLFGLKELTLNSMVQDRSSVSQFTSYEIFRAVGVCAPRVGYAWLTINTDDYGLYANIENYDDLLYGRCFNTTGHVYEGRYGEDLRQDLIDRLDVKEGNPEVRDDMHAIVDALDAPQDGDIYGSEAAQALFDWDAIIAEMAVEQYIGHWDGYAPTRNNWLMHVTEGGKLSLQPWGTDQCFGRASNIYEGQGRLFQTCMGHVGCRAAYEAKFGEVMTAVDALNLEPLIRSVYAAIQPHVLVDPRSPFREAAVANSVNDLINFLARRRQELGTQFECILGENSDPDGDGFRCETDCAPEDPTINPGAVDVCRDGIDQDCNGQADDDPGCPDCEELVRDGHRYLVCTTPRSWQDAEAHCAFFDTHLATLDHPAEAAWVWARAHAISNQDFWIGFNDRDFEGNFSYMFGAGPVAPAAPPPPWAAGQPDNAGEEDCVYVRAADGLFDDFNCLRQKAVICEEVCEFNGDRDHDGINHCSADCNDQDGIIFPGAPEVCGDGIDQDCDDLVDEGEGCDCYQTFHGAHGYRICGGARTANDARSVCLAAGGDLAILDTPGEAAWLHAEALSLTNAPLWIGLQDRFAIDEWAWVDGNPPAYAGWSPGEPSEGGAVDCSVMRGDDGAWDDQACDLTFGAVCEDTCNRFIDTDHDSFPACGTDCDDSRPDVYPGAPEACDGVDQNCDGVVDEGCP